MTESKSTDKAVKDLNNPNLSSNKIDVSNFKEVQKCTNEILKKTNIDILINNLMKKFIINCEILQE